MSGVTAMGVLAGAAVAGTAVTAYSAYEQGNAAEAASNSAAQSATDQLEFEKAQYADWQDVFGGVEDNLSEYYNNLTPDTYEALNLGKLQESYQNSIKQLDTNLAQRGLSSSGLAAQGLTQLETQKMLSSASIRANSDQAVANEKAQFLALGLGQQTTLQNNISNAMGSQTAMYTNQAAQAQQASSAGYAQAGQIAGSGISSYMQMSALNNSSVPSYYTAQNGYYGPYIQ